MQYKTNVYVLCVKEKQIIMYISTKQLKRNNENALFEGILTYAQTVHINKFSPT